MELRARGLASWGKVAPELFTFEKRDGQEAARHG